MTNDEIDALKTLILSVLDDATDSGGFIAQDIAADAIATALRARIPADDGDDKQLRRLLAWCRPRLSRDSYRDTLDKMLVSPPEPDHTPMVQSAGEQRLRVALRETLEQAIGCWVNHYGDNPEGSPVPHHIQQGCDALGITVSEASAPPSRPEGEER